MFSKESQLICLIIVLSDYYSFKWKQGMSKTKFFPVQKGMIFGKLTCRLSQSLCTFLCFFCTSTIFHGLPVDYKAYVVEKKRCKRHLLLSEDQIFKKYVNG